MRAIHPYLRVYTTPDFMNFTPEQQQIFDFVKNGKGHGIIDAVAGAGKTTTIIASAEYVDPVKRILFCAFNRSIAKEIGSRFGKKGMNSVLVKTMHALGRQILVTNNTTGKDVVLFDRKYREILDGTIFPQRTQTQFETLIEVNGLDPEQLLNDNRDFAVRDLLYQTKQRLLNINQKYRSTLCKDDRDLFREMLIHFNIVTDVDLKKERIEEEIDCLFELHKVLLEMGNDLSAKTMHIDFTDMIYLPVKWKLNPGRGFDFLFIDECQDLSRAQLAIALKYARKEARILAVGDPRQSIYGFTGADIESFERIKDYTKAVQLPLTLCFRCPQKMIEEARKIRADIKGHKDYPGTMTTLDPNNIITTARPGDLIISRIKAPLMLLVFNFIRKEVKVSIHEEEVREFLSDLRRIFQKDEQKSNIELVYGGFEVIEKKVMGRWEWRINKDAQRIKDPDERKRYISQETSIIKGKLDFLHDCLIQWKSRCNTILDILKVIKEYISATDNCIRLSSIHRAKGLEEDRVFILDFDILPLTRTDQKPWEEMQEINLKYVAVTRAKEELYLVSSPKTGGSPDEEDEGTLFDELFD